MLKRFNANKKKKRLREETKEFLTASHAGDLEKISKFIRNNFDINSKNEDGLTALHLASKEGHTEVIRELLKRGADVNSTTKRGNGALHMACVGGQLDSVEILLENGAEVNAQSENGFTPLYVAAQENHLDLVRFLLDHGADAALKTDDLFLPLDIALQQGNGRVLESLLERDPSNRSSALPALHFAARINDVRSTRFLLEDGHHDVNGTSTSGFTALHIGSRYGNYDVCQLLIEKGADVNFKAKNDITALHVCSKEGRSALVDLLLSHGADPNSQTTEGLTALHCAAVAGQDHALASLVSNGAQLGLKTKTGGLTPLHMALQSDQLSCTRLLLQHNAPIDDLSEEDNLTPLHVAVHCGNLRSAQILLEAGCDVNAKAKNGFSPLHVACKRNHREMVERLLQHKAAVNQPSDMGILPVHVAAFMGHADILTSLMQNGANLNAPTGGGMTPVYLAALANRNDVIELLLQKGAEVDARTTEQRTALHVASELGNTSDVVCLLQHGASPRITTTEKLLPLDFATRFGHGDVVRLLTEHGAAQEEEGSLGKSRSVTASALAEFSAVREAMRYIRDESDGLKAPVSKKKSLTESSRCSASRSKTSDGDSRLSQTHSSIVLPGSPSLSFWSSFVTDARGGEMVGCRHSGVRVILPPSKIPNPIGIRCRLIRKERLPFPPRLREGEGLACRALETAPPGTKFLGPVIFEVPHFASLRNEEREIVILRSDDGKSWTEHLSPSLDELEPDLKNSLLSDTRQTSGLVHIVTVDLPHFFTLVSRIRMRQEEFSAAGGSLSATLTPKVKITFPPESFKRQTKVGLQAQPVSQIAASKVLGDASFVSPLVTIEPQRRKFRSPVSLTMPLPGNEISTKDTRLLCSLSDGKSQAVWEDISHLTPLTAAGDLVSFTTSVSGKYWLLSSPKVELSDVQELYSMTIPVPYFSRFVIFGKRLSASEGRLRIFCVTDDDHRADDKTLERQQRFVELARSEDVEVFDGTAVYIHLEGNLLPLNATPDDQLHLIFHAFRENRLPLSVTVVDPEAEASARVTFTTEEPGARKRSHDAAASSSSSHMGTLLRVTLPAFDDGRSSEENRFSPVLPADTPNSVKDEEPGLLKAELRLADVAELIGDNWKQVAERLGIPGADVDAIASHCVHPTDRALAVLQQWMDENGSRANGNSLEKALRHLGMDDIITSCMINVADVTDAEEKAAAKSYLGAGIDPLGAELGSARDLLGSSVDGETLRHSLSPDDAYEETELTKAGLLLPSGGRKTSDEDEVALIRERFPFVDRSVSTNTLTTLASSDGGDNAAAAAETLNQSVTCRGLEDVPLTRAEVGEDVAPLLPPVGVTFRLGESQETAADIEGNSDSLLRKQPSAEVIATCKVISQRDNETEVTRSLESDPNSKITSQDPLPKYQEDESPLICKSSEILSQNIRSLSTDQSAKEGQLESMTESSYSYLEPGPQHELLLEDVGPDEEQTAQELFQYECSESSESQHEFLLREPTSMSGGRQSATQSPPCEDLRLQQAEGDAASQDTESGHQSAGKPTSIEWESGILSEISLQNSASEFIDKERHISTESNLRCLDSYRQSENLSLEESAENSESERGSVNEVKPLKSASQTQQNVFSHGSQQPEDRQQLTTTESVGRYLDSDPEHISTCTTDESDLVTTAAGSGYKRLEPGPMHTAPLENASSNYPKQEATESEYEHLEQETDYEIPPEELAPERSLEERRRAFAEQSISGKTEAAEVCECQQRDLLPPETVGQGIDSRILEIKDNLPLSAFEEDDDITGAEKPAEGTLVQFYEVSPAQELRGHESDENAFDGTLLHDHLLFDHRTLEDEERTDGDMLKHSRVILRRRVHKKTLLTAGCQEQTIVTEDTQVEQDNEAPKELSSAIQQIIEQFVHGKNSFVTCYNAC